MPEFEKFLKSFSLSSKAEEIEYILELETGVTKHYEALVPEKITPDLFWARYFFKVNVFIISSLDSVLESAYDEEEELTWGEEEDDTQDQESEDIVDNTASASCQPPGNSTSLVLEEDSKSAVAGENTPPSEKDGEVGEVALLAARNILQLQQTNSTLAARSEMLEAEVEKLQNQLIKERTISAKLRNGLTVAEHRQKELVEEVDVLRDQLARMKAEAEAVSGIESTADRECSVSQCSDSLASKSSASRSHGSSIVDLGSEHSPSPLHPVESESEGSGSLQSVSSPSDSDQSPPPSPSPHIRDEGEDKGHQRKAEGEHCPAEDEDDTKGVPLSDESEEEWDNEAWE